ncbi:MAG: thymidine phosphorylase [bacterium]
MNQVDIIARKRDGEELAEAELEFLISGYVEGTVPDYQVAAFLMAVYFRGLSAAESATLTRLMRDSGVVLNHADIDGFKVDKHSTGGVGDKVSIVLAPLAASAGLVVPMISGRALAHTGGTLDKLEAIPGFRTQLTLPELKKQLREIGVVLVGQTADLTPADKKIYALRDATATVNSIPLITASILSKKMAEGIDALVLDVKAGSGAIFEDEDNAWQLARTLVKTANEFDLETAAIVTSMEQPVGNAIGNWLETKEAIDTLRGEGPADLKQLTFVLCAQMLLFADKISTLAEGFDLLDEKINSGAAFDKFLEIVTRQGGDASVVEHPETYQKPELECLIKSDRDGVIAHINCREVGIVSMALGAGRSSVDDGIDFTSGIVLRKKVGDRVAAGETIATAYSDNRSHLEANIDRLQNAFLLSEREVEPEPLIYGMIDAAGDKKWDASTRTFG